MNEIGVYSPEQSRLLWHDYLSRQQLRPSVQKNYPERRPVDEVSPHRVFVKNTTEEEIPPHACMRITGVTTVGGRTAVTVEKPSSEDGEFLFNGPFPIDSESDGSGSADVIFGVGWAYRHGVVVMLGDEPTAPCRQYRPIVSSWEIEEGNGPFVVFGRHDVSERALIGRFAAANGITHGIVLEKLGCGDYTIELADWAGDPDTIGSGFGDTSGIGDCDSCFDVINEGTADCAIVLTTPPSQCIGRGVYVRAHDYASTTIPLVVGTDCLLVNLGDTIGGGGSAGGGSGSGSTDEEPVWQILRGYQEHAVEYKIVEDSCCDGSGETGAYTILRKQPLIFIAHRCPIIDCGTCTPGSGS